MRRDFPYDNSAQLSQKVLSVASTYHSLSTIIDLEVSIFMRCRSQNIDGRQNAR